MYHNAIKCPHCLHVQPGFVANEPIHRMKCAVCSKDFVIEVVESTYAHSEDVPEDNESEESADGNVEDLHGDPVLRYVHSVLTRVVPHQKYVFAYMAGEDLVGMLCGRGLNETEKVYLVHTLDRYT